MEKRGWGRSYEGWFAQGRGVCWRWSDCHQVELNIATHICLGYHQNYNAVLCLNKHTWIISTPESYLDIYHISTACEKRVTSRLLNKHTWIMSTSESFPYMHHIHTACQTHVTSRLLNKHTWIIHILLFNDTCIIFTLLIKDSCNISTNIFMQKMVAYTSHRANCINMIVFKITDICTAKH